MALNPKLFDRIRCPVNGQTLTLADDAMVKALNDKIEAGKVFDVGDEEVVDRVDALLVRDDKEVLYAVRDDIPVLIGDRGISAAEVA